MAFLKVVVLGATSSRNSRLSRRDMALAASVFVRDRALLGGKKVERIKKKMAETV